MFTGKESRQRWIVVVVVRLRMICFDSNKQVRKR